MIAPLMQHMIQTVLKSGDREMVTWLPRDPRVRLGSVVSLEESDVQWTVKFQSHALDVSSIPRGWRVGGLF